MENKVLNDFSFAWSHTDSKLPCPAKTWHDNIVLCLNKNVSFSITWTWNRVHSFKVLLMSFWLTFLLMQPNISSPDRWNKSMTQLSAWLHLPWSISNLLDTGEPILHCEFSWLLQTEVSICKFIQNHGLWTELHHKINSSYLEADK